MNQIEINGQKIGWQRKFSYFMFKMFHNDQCLLDIQDREITTRKQTILIVKTHKYVILHIIIIGYLVPSTIVFIFAFRPLKHNR